MNPKVQYASQLIIEDHLKKVLGKTEGKAFKTSDNKFLPRPQDSAFGDFPKSFKTKKTQKVEQVKPLDLEMQSGAAT